VPAGAGAAGAAAVARLDTAEAARLARRVAPLLARPVAPGGDGVAAWAQRQLACPALALAEAGVALPPAAAPRPGAWWVERACRGW
jgi:hypothetical protein